MGSQGQEWEIEDRPLNGQDNYPLTDSIGTFSMETQLAENAIRQDAMNRMRSTSGVGLFKPAYPADTLQPPH